MPRTTGDGPRTNRGISLLEVLISMFVLLFGLMGVAAIFPVGNHYAGKGEQFDRSTALADAAFAELKARGVLRPEMWMYAGPRVGNVAPTTGTSGSTTYSNPTLTPFVIQPEFTIVVSSTQRPGIFNQQDSAIGPGHAFVIDPMGAAAGIDEQVAGDGLTEADNLDVFPIYDAAGDRANNDNPWSPPAASWPNLLGGLWPVRRVTLPAPDPTVTAPNTAAVIPMPTRIAEATFRLRDDLAVQFPKESDRPARQMWSVNVNGLPDDDPDRTPSDAPDTRLTRQFSGNYSWLATVVPSQPDGLVGLQPSSPSFGSSQYDVTVAVLYKRVATPSAATERAIPAVFLPGGELAIYATNSSYDPEAAVDDAVKEIRAGQWIAVAGVNPLTGQFLLKWYRLLSLDDETAVRNSSNPQPLLPEVPAATAVRRAMLEDADWPTFDLDNDGVPDIDPNMRAILMPGVVAATTETVVIGPAESEWGQ